MAYASFSSFLETLEKEGELIRVPDPLATELEITALADREMKQKDGGRALLIERPTVNGEVSPYPVAINTLGSFRRMALSFQAASVQDVAQELGSLMKAKPPTGAREAMKLLGTALELRHAKPKLVRSADCQEVVHRFDEGKGEAPSAGDCPTLLDIPILKCWPDDGGRFITLPCVVTKDPVTGERNV